MARKAMREQDETPEYEARSHSPAFLKKAARLASKGRGKVKRKSIRKMGRHHGRGSR